MDWFRALGVGHLKVIGGQLEEILKVIFQHKPVRYITPFFMFRVKSTCLDAVNVFPYMSTAA